APAFPKKYFVNQPLMLKPVLGFSFVKLVSATKISPFGNSYNQRGCSKDVANAFTLTPGAAIGLLPSFHPTASATFTVGMNFFSGSGSVGLGPIPAEMSCLADSAQPPNAMATNTGSING